MTMRLAWLLCFLTLVLASCVTMRDPVELRSSSGVRVSYDLSAAKALLELLAYVDELHGGKEFNGSNPVEVQAVLDHNLADKVYRHKVEAVLSCPVYDSLASNMQSSTIPAQGKNAYRQALYRLPFLGMGLRGGVDQQISQLLQNLPRADEFLRTTTKGLLNQESADRILDTVGTYLPQASINKDFQVFLYFDGNRGSFTSGGVLYLDLMAFPAETGLPEVERIIAHEIHHTLYRPMFQGKAHLSVGKIMLHGWQEQVLLEGSAQFCNFQDYPPLVQYMAMDRELGTAIFQEWERTFLASYTGKLSPGDFQSKLEIYNQSHAQALLESWLNTLPPEQAPTQEVRQSLWPYRPVVHYYVGYRIFRAIHDKGGMKAMVTAMENPGNLLFLYRELAMVDSSLPPISQDMAQAWVAIW